jgi:1-pyrroline-4-hydroxy-2-carboxylate deaminase
MSKSVFSGVMPALMTPCDASRQPDFAALVAKARELTGLGMSAVIYAGSMGDWPLLTDEQRMEGVERLTAAGVRVIVGTGAQNPMRAAALAAHARKAGAAGLMVIPRVLSRGTSPSAQEAHFAGILEAAVDLPSVIYNSPYYGFETKADLFLKLHARYPHLVGFKEFGSAAAMSYAAEHIVNRSEKLTLMVGVDTEVFHGYVNCGASGAITGIGNALPREVLHLARLCEAAQRGDPAARRHARELEGALKVLSTFDEGTDLVLYYKYIMTLEGNAGYELHFNPTDQLNEGQKRFAREQLALFKRWYARWTVEAASPPAAAAA